MYSAYGAYELKALYQRNLLIGAAVATLLGVVVGIVLFISDSSPRSHHPLRSGELVVLSTGNSRLAPRWEDLSAPLSEHPGFWGFKPNIRIVPDRTIGSRKRRTETTAPSSAVVAHSMFDLNSSLFDRLTTFGDAGRRLGTYADKPDSDSAEPPKDKEVSVVRKIDPDYPLNALEDRKEGRVTIRVCVGEDGLLRPFEVDVVKRHRRTVQQVTYMVVHEEPEGYSFAENLQKVLPQWMFRPMIENGNPVEAQLDITYTFVLSGARQYSLQRVPPSGFRFRGFR